MSKITDALSIIARSTDISYLKNQAMFWCRHAGLVHGQKDEMRNYHAIDWNNEYDDGLHFVFHSGSRDECIGYCHGAKFLHGKVVVGSPGQKECMVCWPDDEFGTMVVLANSC